LGLELVREKDSAPVEVTKPLSSSWSCHVDGVQEGVSQFQQKTVVSTATVNPTQFWKSELDQMATTVLKPESFVDIVVFAVEDNFGLPTD
jgi:hypothetical protein